MRYLLVVALTLLLALPATARDFETGKEAYLRGDYATALRELEPLAAEGDVGSQYFLGLMYYNGQGVPQDYEKAAEWYRRSAEQGGFFLAQLQLGLIHKLGHGVPQDDAEAVAWFRKAAEEADKVVSQGLRGPSLSYVGAAYNALGLAYANGYGIPKDDGEAARWYQKAAELGDAIGQNELGVMYLRGVGVLQDYAEAAKWFRMAAEQGYAEGQVKFGDLHLLGWGVPRNYVKAHMWFNLAAAQGNKTAAEHRKSVASRMTPAQIAEAQRLAREWRARHDK